MKILDRYIGETLVHSTLLVTLILLPLFTLLDLVQQLDDIGTGNYGLVDALIYEVLLMPSYLLTISILFSTQQAKTSLCFRCLIVTFIRAIMLLQCTSLA